MTWGSRNAEDMFRIAVHLAGFSGPELMKEIHRQQCNRTADVNLTTVLNAMQVVSDRYEEEKREMVALTEAIEQR